ncbi:endonuclease [Hymenobacter sp. ASUV-10]|uniref:Endonuclease n=1 Tax=Hymenobacter aranciens TaxID=3063996 RepID=A0ABT9BGR3_9BACT|nr:endonuclease [Hymenobacter sp. ASUV-10]MDO7877454.1 endonuclease [Hymenobacter sp. ASUV-10]
MKKLFFALLLSLPLLPAAAQTFPPVPAFPPAALQGQALRDWLRTNWYDGKRNVLSYGQARAKMYNYADNYNNSVTCVYSGYNTPVPLNFNSSSTSSAANINCEHTIPQSWFSEVPRMVSDMHHLYPTYIQWNSNRGNNPFFEIPDANGTTWMRNTTSQTTIPTTNIDEYSEATRSQFEPREDHKGNVARTAFYFYTMHEGQPQLAATGHQSITSLADLATLYQWHLADPVDARERERNRRVAASQGNYNPFIEYPELAALAYGLTPTGPVITFAGATGSIAEGNSGTRTYTLTLNVAPAPAAALTVQVALNAAASTATNGSDFTFTSPATVTFAAGQTSATTTITINGDTQPELDETVILNLTTPGTGASIGSPATHTLTITNDDGAAPALAFASATGAIAEGNSGTSTHTVNVTLSNASGITFPLTLPVTVDATSTATSPADYTLDTPLLTFASAAALTQAITVTVVGDTNPEPTETVVLHLGAPSAAGVVLGTPSTYTLNITNDDANPTGTPCSRLFFTQYAEASAGNNKALEFFNPSQVTIDLTGKRIELFANGATTPTNTLALTGTLAPGATYVVTNSGSTDAGLIAASNITSNVTFFNGNDAIVLFDGTDTLDIIGVVGQSPTEWTTAGGGSTLNNTLVRLPATEMGGNWNGPNGSITWTSGGVDIYTGFGSYTSIACVVTGTRTPSVLRKGLEIYPNPATESVRLRLPAVAGTLAATVEVLDPLGRVVRARPANIGAADAVLVDLRGLAAGLYAVRVTTGAVQYTGRLVLR